MATYSHDTIEHYKNTPGKWTDTSLHTEFKYIIEDYEIDVLELAEIGEELDIDSVAVDVTSDPNNSWIDVLDFKSWLRAQIIYGEELADCGAEYMDTNYPDWRDRVAAERLHMDNGFACVLGQYFGEYTKGIREIYHQRLENDNVLEGESDSTVPSGEWAKAHGFIDNGACYLALDLAWQKELRKGTI